MKKFILTLFSLLFVSTAMLAESKDLSIKKPFNKLATSAGVDVTYTPSGGQARVRITGPASKISNVEVTVKGTTLSISGNSRKGKHFFNAGQNLRGVKISVSGPLVTHFEASSGSSIKCISNLNSASARFNMEVSSGAQINISSMRGANAEFDASSGGSIKIQNVTATKMEFDASSGASISVTRLSAGSLDADASSGASIKLAGNAQKGYLEASSGGSIHALSLKLLQSNIKKSSSGSIRIH